MVWPANFPTIPSSRQIPSLRAPRHCGRLRPGVVLARAGGYCRADRGMRLCSEFAHTKDCIQTTTAQWRGEDKNLDGNVDPNESDPLKVDTNGNGVLDEQEFFNCLLQKRTDC